MICSVLLEEGELFLQASGSSIGTADRYDRYTHRKHFRVITLSGSPFSKSIKKYGYTVVTTIHSTQPLSSSAVLTHLWVGINENN